MNKNTLVKVIKFTQYIAEGLINFIEDVTYGYSNAKRVRETASKVLEKYRVQQEKEAQSIVEV